MGPKILLPNCQEKGKPEVNFVLSLSQEEQSMQSTQQFWNYKRLNLINDDLPLGSSKRSTSTTHSHFNTYHVLTMHSIDVEVRAKCIPSLTTCLVLITLAVRITSSKLARFVQKQIIRKMFLISTYSTLTGMVQLTALLYN